MQVFYLGRALHTKETLPNFLKWCPITQHPLVFRGLTGSQRTPWKWGVTAYPRNDANTVVGFIQRNILSRFGTPRTIITDEGSHYANKPFVKLMTGY